MSSARPLCGYLAIANRASCFVSAPQGQLGFGLSFCSLPFLRGKELEHAGSLISYAFSEFESSWFFVLLALVPALLLVLALAQWVRSPEGGTKSNWIKWGGALATLASLVVCWPAAITAAQATYYAFRPSDA